MIEQAWNYKSVVAKDLNNTGGGDNIQPIIKYYKLLINTTPIVKYFLPYVITCIINKQKWDRLQLLSSYEGDYTDVVAFSVVTNSPIPFESTSGFENGLATFDEFSQAVFGDDLMFAIQEITEDEYYKI